MQKYTSWKPLTFLLICFSFSISAAAEPYKLYINKHDSEQNVVLLENELSASVKHTSEGMEITLQGVEISMRCRGNTSSTDGCTIAIEPSSTATSTTTSTTDGATNTSAGSSGSGTTTSTTGSSGSDDCASGTSTWANSDCDGSSTSTNTDGSGSTNTSGGGSTTTTTTTSGGDSTGGCGGNVVCSTRDFGPLTSVTQQQYTLRSSIYAFPMSAPNLSGFGSITWATTASTPTNRDGSSLRVWFSKSAGGTPLTTQPQCGSSVSTISARTYFYGSGRDGYCNLDTGTKYWANFAYCPGAAGADLRCLNSKEPAQELRLYIAP